MSILMVRCKITPSLDKVKTSQNQDGKLDKDEVYAFLKVYLKEKYGEEPKEKEGTSTILNSLLGMTCFQFSIIT